jgi:hypothetical protein
MKPVLQKRFRAALLLLLLAVSLGGMGLFTTGLPQAVATWLQSLTGTSTGPPPTDSQARTDLSGQVAAEKKTDPSAPGSSPSAEDRRVYDPKALPKGLTSIDGEGGTGLNRAVRKNGVWFPVYSPGPNPGSGPPPLTVIPLSIASGNPPPGRVNETFSYQAEAIGGTPPYAWSAALTTPPGTFTFGAADGLLTGLSKEPITAKATFTLTDAEGGVDTAVLTLVIRPGQELTIDTTTIPTLPLGEPVDFRFTASGGVPPYSWLTPGVVNGLSVSVDSGQLKGGPPVEAKDENIMVTVTDSQGTKVEKEFLLSVRGTVDITTPSALPVAVPGRAYRGTFAATGGTPPYQWELNSGSLPGSSWQLSKDGVLTGQGSNGNQLSEFAVIVTDADGGTFEKKFRLASSDFLIARASREKVGLAWPRAAVADLLASSGLSAAGFRVLRDGEAVFEGAANNFVDRNVPTGSTPRYTLIVLTHDGGAQPVAETETVVLPQTLTRAQPGTTGDPYADRVVSFRPLTAGGYGSGSLPRNVTGPPDGRSVYSPAYKPGEVLSLHARSGAGGSIELEFTDNIVEMGPGEDLTIFENVLFVGGSANQRFMEPATIKVALFLGEWVSLPCDVVPPAAGQTLDLRDPFYYSRGIAGRNGTTGDDPTNPSRSGGDSLDLELAAARAGLSWIRYIRIESTGDLWRQDDVGGDPIRHPADPAFSPLSGAGSSGFDLDAVSAVHY